MRRLPSLVLLVAALGVVSPPAATPAGSLMPAPMLDEPAPRRIALKAWTPQRCTQEAGATYLCLRGGRFRIDMTWTTQNDGLHDVLATAVPLNDGSGTFWFFSPDNSEILVKVLDGCGVNRYRWAFFAATTNVGFTLQVTDLEKGIANIYHNDVGEVARPVQDTRAFLCD